MTPTPAFHLMAGLPRSGSTLLTALLNQNPDVYATVSSPICAMLTTLERTTYCTEQFKAAPNPDVVPAVLRGALSGWYSDRSEPVIVDKSRGWSVPENYGTIMRTLGYPPKVLMTVRDIPSILASFAALQARNPPDEVSFIDREIEQRQEFNSYRPVEDIRCDHLMRPKGIIDAALYGISFALNGDYRDSFHFVEYDDLVDDPEKVMDGVYAFLGLPAFPTAFSGITQPVRENDSVYGMPGMHYVRPSVSRNPINPEDYLSTYVLKKYTGLESWRPQP